MICNMRRCATPHVGLLFRNRSAVASAAYLVALEGRLAKRQKASELRLADLQKSLKVDLAKAQEASELRQEKAKESLKADLAKAQEASELRQEKAQKSLKADLAKAQEASELRHEKAQESLKADFKAFFRQERASILIQLFTTVVAGATIAISTFLWSGGDVVSPWRNHSNSKRIS